MINRISLFYAVEEKEKKLNGQPIELAKLGEIGGREDTWGSTTKLYEGETAQRHYDHLHEKTRENRSTTSDVWRER